MRNEQIEFKEKLKSVILHHYKNCKKYKKILDFLKYDVKKKHDLKDQPVLPVNLFKEQDLISIPKQKIYKTNKSHAFWVLSKFDGNRICLGVLTMHRGTLAPFPMVSGSALLGWII